MFNKRVYTERSRSGFTLAELLIAVIIVAILSTVALVMFKEAQKEARDSKRRQDLVSIQLALESYNRRNNHYPCTTTRDTGAEEEWQKSTGTQDPWIIDDQCSGPPFGEDYISKLPQDPVNSGSPWFEDGQEKYAYAYWAGPTAGNSCPQTAGQYYILVARLEKSGSKDASPETIVNLCDGETPVLALIPAFDFGLNDLYILTSD